MIEFMWPTNNDEPDDAEEQWQQQVDDYMNQWIDAYVVKNGHWPSNEEENAEYQRIR